MRTAFLKTGLRREGKEGKVLLGSILRLTHALPSPPPSLPEKPWKRTGQRGT